MHKAGNLLNIQVFQWSKRGNMLCPIAEAC